MTKSWVEVAELRWDGLGKRPCGERRMCRALLEPLQNSLGLGLEWAEGGRQAHGTDRGGRVGVGSGGWVREKEDG